MSEFHKFKEAVNNQFELMSKGNLFTTGVSKEDVWDMYLSSFPEGTNPMFRTRTEHDCSCCKQFIRACANVVAIIDNKMVSIWDINIGGHYQVVADALSKLVKSQNIQNVFRHYDKNLGTDENRELLESNEVIIWKHFHYKLPEKFVLSKRHIPTYLGEKQTNKDMLYRALTEITPDAIESVLDLINDKLLYKGDEFLNNVKFLKEIQSKFNSECTTQESKDFFCWKYSFELGMQCRIKNSVIGTLLSDLSDGIDIEVAVKKYESKTAPQNYQRPSALITKGMIKEAEKKVQALGLEQSLHRRHANIHDIKINNVLFADRSAKKVMGVFDSLSQQVSPTIPTLDKIQEVSIEDFVKNVLPYSTSMELLVENSHTNNFVSLVAPEYADAPSIFKWGNNFSYSYNGEVADSMKQRVKSAGGNVDGVLRFSIQWNDGDNNQNDFDAHCIEPSGNLIHFPSKGRQHPSSGMLDVDITSPGRKVAVENITWTNKNKMQEGEYEFLVHNYSHNGGRTGFTAEIEYDGVIYSYTYDKNVPQSKKIQVAKIVFSKTNGITFIESLPSSKSSKTVWNIPTEQFQKVSVVMNSPNHWEGENSGNKHWFFMLENCLNPDKVRGFYNEFLMDNLKEHRKVFESLGSQLKADYADTQLSGVGFSSTQRNHVICKVSGKSNQLFKIKF